MPVIGLTGNIASGKSLVSGILAEQGARIIDADKVAREVVSPGSTGWKEIRESFGDQILNPDLTVNRKALGSLVFADQARMSRLNAITHPLIIKEIRTKIDDFRSRAGNQRELLVVDAPLLIETGLHRYVDEVWVVDIPAEMQVRRLMARDGIGREKALQKISSQMPAVQKRGYAQVVIDNSGEMNNTRRFVTELLAKRFGIRGAGY